jgi:hypothetical protein
MQAIRHKIKQSRHRKMRPHLAVSILAQYLIDPLSSKRSTHFCQNQITIGVASGKNAQTRGINEQCPVGEQTN